MSHIPTFVQNDTKPDLDFTIRDKTDNSPIDLTGSTVRFKFRKKGGDKTVINTGHETCTLTDAVNGGCRYSFISGDLAKVGLHEGELEVIFPSGAIHTYCEFIEFYVREEL